jgi:hypothetical protein
VRAERLACFLLYHFVTILGGFAPSCGGAWRYRTGRAGDESLVGEEHTCAVGLLAGSQCRGKNDGDIPLPTILPSVPPHPRREPEKRSRAGKIFDVLFNGALIVSALILTFIVLVREEQYAYGEQEDPAMAIEQSMMLGQLDMTDQKKVIPPSD